MIIKDQSVRTIRHGTRTLTLKLPLLVSLTTEDGFFFALNDMLRIVGTGSSEAEAMEDFCSHVVHFYDYYRALPDDKVIGQAVLLKQIFEGLFVEEA